jgi:hypothetical protein
MSEDVKAAGGNPSPFAVLPEPLRQPLGMDRAAELIGKDEVAVGVSGEL